MSLLFGGPRPYYNMNKTGKKQAGFTLAELMMTIVIGAILIAIAVPAINNWLPNYRLRAAARDLYSTLQRARLLAVKENTTVQVRFDNTVTPGFYYFDTTDDDIFTAGEFRIDLSTYGSGVDFGTGNAAQNWNSSACTQATAISFGSRGTANAGSVYLQNQNADVCYAITTITSGSVKLRKYTGILPFSITNWD